MTRTPVRAVALALLLAAPSAPLSAQRAGSVELGAFGQYTIFDDKLQLENHLGAGGRLGVFVVDNLSLEGEAVWVPTRFRFAGGGDVTYRPLAVRLVYGAPVGESVQLLLGAGYQRSIFDIKVSPTNLTSRTVQHNAITGLAGLRFILTPNISLRAEFVTAYHPSSGSVSGTTPLGTAGAASGGVSAGVTTDGIAGCNPNNPLHPCVATPPACGCVPPPNAPPANAAGRASYWVHGLRLGLSLLLPRGRSVEAPLPPPIVVPQARPETVTVVRIDTVQRVIVDTVRQATPQVRIPTRKEVPVRPEVPIPTRKEPAPVAPRVPPSAPRGPGGGRGQMLRDLPAAGEAIFEANDTYFRPGTTELTAAGADSLTRVAQSLIANPSVTVELSGHTDSGATDPVTTSMLRRRVESVRAFLRSRGVDDSRLTLAWYSDTRPLVPNDTPDGRRINRRVEIRRMR